MKRLASFLAFILFFSNLPMSAFLDSVSSQLLAQPSHELFFIQTLTSRVLFANQTYAPKETASANRQLTVAGMPESPHSFLMREWELLIGLLSNAEAVDPELYEGIVAYLQENGIAYWHKQKKWIQWFHGDDKFRGSDRNKAKKRVTLVYQALSQVMKNSQQDVENMIYAHEMKHKRIGFLPADQLKWITNEIFSLFMLNGSLNTTQILKSAITKTFFFPSRFDFYLNQPEFLVEELIAQALSTSPRKILNELSLNEPRILLYTPMLFTILMRNLNKLVGLTKRIPAPDNNERIAIGIASKRYSINIDDILVLESLDEQFPKSVHIKKALLLAYRYLHRNEELPVVARELIAINPDEPLAYEVLASWHYGQKEFEQAINYGERWAFLNPNIHRIHAMLASAYIKLSHDQPEQDKESSYRLADMHTIVAYRLKPIDPITEGHYKLIRDKQQSMIQKLRLYFGKQYFGNAITLSGKLIQQWPDCTFFIDFHIRSLVEIPSRAEEAFQLATLAVHLYPNRELHRHTLAFVACHPNRIAA